MKDINKNFFFCNQKWEEMPTQADNRWCEQCSQCVVDFRHMAVPEIKSIHKSSDSKVCGVYTKDQVVQLYPAPKNSFPFASYNKKVVAGLLAFFSLTITANGQSDTLVFDHNKNWVCPIDTAKVKVGQKETPVTSDSIIIRGTVTDDNGETLFGASVLIKGSNFGTITDFNGKYELSVPIAMLNTLTFMYTGYQSVSIDLKEYQPTIDVNLIQDVNFTASCVLGGIAPRKYKPWHRGFWRQLFYRWR